MAAIGFITTAELNFDTYRANLKTFLSSQDNLKDYNFEGSNFAVLLDVLAYNTYLNGFYLNMIGSEMFLDTATMFESVYSHAKELNYTPASRSSSGAVVNFALSGLANNAAYVTIPKNFRVVAPIAGKNFIFSTQDSITVSKTTCFVSSNVTVYEGRVATEFFTEANTSSTKTRYVLSSANIDVSTIDVKVRPSISTNNYYSYIRAQSLYGLTGTSNSYFIQGYGAGKYEVVFGNGVTGASLIPGNIVQVTYLDSSASAGDYGSNFTALDTLYDNTGTPVVSNNIRVITVSSSRGGAERESIESVKFNAPRYFSTQDRAVTTSDYTALIKSKFPSIQAVTVFGGEEDNPKQYGKVLIITKTYGSDKTPDSVKLAMGNYLRERMPLSITPLFREPDYIYVKINTTVYYNQSLTTKTASDIRSTVISAVSNYSATNLQNFSQNFRFSKFTSAIDDSDPSIVGNDTVVQMIKRLTPEIGVSYGTTIQFHNPIYLTTSITDPSVNSSTFYINVNGTSTAANIKDDGSGLLYLVTDTYSKSIGTINYTTGEINLAELVVSSYTNYISLYAYTSSLQDIVIERDQILEIDPADLTISVETALN